MANEHIHGGGTANSNEAGKRSGSRQSRANETENTATQAGQGKNRRHRTKRHMTVTVEHKRPQITPEDQMEKETFSKPRTRKARGGSRRRGSVERKPDATL